MEQVQLDAILRKKEEVGKKYAKRLRNEGFIPAVVYKAAEQTLCIAVRERDFTKTLKTGAGENVIIELKIKDDGAKTKSKTVIVKDIQHHPFKDHMLHVDFNEISLHEAIRVKVPIALKGEAIGVKRDAGVLEHILWELQIECLPTQIPEKIEVDVSGMEVGHSKVARDLTLPSQIKVLDNPEQIVVSVSAKKAVEEVVVAAEGAEEVAEPEVIREKKPEAEEAAEGTEQEKPPKKEEKK